MLYENTICFVIILSQILPNGKKNILNLNFVMEKLTTYLFYVNKFEWSLVGMRLSEGMDLWTNADIIDWMIVI